MVSKLVKWMGAGGEAVRLETQPEYTLGDYWKAPSGEGLRAAEWRNKPHRLIYDLLVEIAELRARMPFESRR